MLGLFNIQPPVAIEFRIHAVMMFICCYWCQYTHVDSIVSDTTE